MGIHCTHFRPPLPSLLLRPLLRLLFSPFISSVPPHLPPSRISLLPVLQILHTSASTQEARSSDISRCSTVKSTLCPFAQPMASPSVTETHLSPWSAHQIMTDAHGYDSVNHQGHFATLIAAHHCHASCFSPLARHLPLALAFQHGQLTRSYTNVHGYGHCCSVKTPVNTAHSSMLLLVLLLLLMMMMMLIILILITG
jgi:hypothetical protein